MNNTKYKYSSVYCNKIYTRDRPRVIVDCRLGAGVNIKNNNFNDNFGGRKPNSQTIVPILVNNSTNNGQSLTSVTQSEIIEILIYFDKNYITVSVILTRRSLYWTFLFFFSAWTLWEGLRSSRASVEGALTRVMAGVFTFGERFLFELLLRSGLVHQQIRYNWK